MPEAHAAPTLFKTMPLAVQMAAEQDGGPRASAQNPGELRPLRRGAPDPAAGRGDGADRRLGAAGGQHDHRRRRSPPRAGVLPQNRARASATPASSPRELWR